MRVVRRTSEGCGAWVARLAMGGVGALAMTACGAVYDGVEGSTQSDGEAIDDVGNVDLPIINGSTNFTGREYQQNRTVNVRTPTGALCSGTLLLPNVIMTARHCVTTDSSVGGPLGAPTSVRARIRSAPVEPAPPGEDDCRGSAATRPAPRVL